MLEWEKLLCQENFKSEKAPDSPPKEKPTFDWLLTTRTRIERDHDRILFSAPVRRLADKTQVFPLEKNISIRNRLTHSYEVANLARSIGNHLCSKESGFEPFRSISDSHRDIPAILAAVGLAHDLGNPPFGHQGEKAIQAWFQKKDKKFWNPSDSLPAGELPLWVNDFLRFEGNAQTLRVLMRLQHADSPYGLNLSFGTLAALMKYPAGSHETNKAKGICYKKFGYFASEHKLVEEIWKHTGLQSGVRHPIVYIMEACDDIAYSVLDIEDGIKKQLISFHDIMAFLRKNEHDPCIKHVYERSSKDYEALLTNNSRSLSPLELNDVATQKFRVHAIHTMISAAIYTFKKEYDPILSSNFKGDLISASSADNLCKQLKKFAIDNCFKHRSVLEIELRGYNVIHELMDYLWIGITDRAIDSELDSERKTPFSVYAYHRISENYRCVFEGKRNTSHEAGDLPIRYKECQLLTDMISGMADSYAVELCEELRALYRRDTDAIQK